MELVIGFIILAAGIAYITYRSLDRKIEAKHSVTEDAPYKIEPPVLETAVTTKPDGIGHESVVVENVVVEEKTKKPKAKKNAAEKVAKATTPRKTTKKAK